jgi:hypothetical protein
MLQHPDHQVSLLCIDHRQHSQHTHLALFAFKMHLGSVVQFGIIVGKSVIREAAILHNGVIAQKVNECDYN